MSRKICEEDVNYIKVSKTAGRYQTAILLKLVLNYIPLNALNILRPMNVCHISTGRHIDSEISPALFVPISRTHAETLPEGEKRLSAEFTALVYGMSPQSLGDISYILNFSLSVLRKCHCSIYKAH